MCLKDHPNMPFEFTPMEPQVHKEEEWKWYADLRFTTSPLTTWAEKAGICNVWAQVEPTLFWAAA